MSLTQTELVLKPTHMGDIGFVYPKSPIQEVCNYNLMVMDPKSPIQEVCTYSLMGIEPKSPIQFINILKTSLGSKDILLVPFGSLKPVFSDPDLSRALVGHGES